MATRNYTDVKILLWGGYNLVGAMSQISTLQRSAVLEDVTCFGTAAQTFSDAGERMGKFSFSGYYDDATLGSNAALTGNVASFLPLCVGVAGNAVGQPFTGTTGAEQTTNRTAAIGKMTHISADMVYSGESDEGQIQFPLGAISGATTNSASIDFGSTSSANGLVAYLQVPALTLGSATNLAVTMQDSADNSSWANITGGAFTVIASSITTTPVAQRLVISGTIRRYTRAVLTFTTSSTGASATVFVGIFRGTTASGPVSLIAPSGRARTALDVAASVLGPDDDRLTSIGDAEAAPPSAADDPPAVTPTPARSSVAEDDADTQKEN